MRDGKALQSGTSHFLGQNFAKAFDIQYLDSDNTQKYVWTTSWGVSTRMVGAVVMTHGDDAGLRLPPKIAPIQVVGIPIYKTPEQREQVVTVLQELLAALKAAGVRTHLDDRDQTPGYKFNEWEMRGVPVRLEVGPRDLEKNNCVLVRRDMEGKARKSFESQDGIVETVNNLLAALQAALLEQATAFRDANIADVDSYDAFKEVIASGKWARGWWNENLENELKVKDDTGATLRCYPLEQPGGEGVSFYDGATAGEVALFAKAY